MGQTEEEKAAFVALGRSILTSFAIHARQLDEWTAAFDHRGGSPEYGNDAALVAGISNKIQEFLKKEDTLALVAKLRSDY